MDFTKDDNGGEVEAVELHQATRSRYLNYALSVITSRALPDIRDGLKPVQRRILYTMYQDLKLRADTRYLKSARVVGEVMGKYHPHGDQAIYDAMVRMAQPFSLRAPLVDGQGNFGSIDGDSAAAMRYTEARLRPIAAELLSEINQGTVDFRASYDGQLEEPVVLPAQLPNLLINGASGIAVGMATNIPPHNLRELVAALLFLIKKPEASLEEICNSKQIKGPDFPTGGEILNSEEEIRAVYEKGQGPIKLRGEYEVEAQGRKRQLVIKSLPYALNKSSLVEKIAQLIINRKVPQILDIRDESSDKIRVVMELKRGASPEVAMAYLFKHTPLQSNYHLNLTALVPTDDPQVKAPRRLGLLEILKEFLGFRMEVASRRLQHQLKGLEKIIHRLEGFEIAFGALDGILQVIRESASRAAAASTLMAQFSLSKVQAEAILEMKLYRLARLEIEEIRRDLKEKRAEAAKLQALLADEQARWTLIRDELRRLRKRFGEPRRTQLSGPDEGHDFDAERYILKENTWVILSRQGRLKRQRGFTEVSAIRVPEGDEIGWVLRTDTTQTFCLFTQMGGAYSIRVAEIASTTGYGDPVQANFGFSDGERIIGVACSDPLLLPEVRAREPELQLPGLEGVPKIPGPFGVVMTRRGRTARFSLKSYLEPSKRTGRRFLNLEKGDEVLSLSLASGDENLALASARGRVMIFPINQIPPKRGAVKGVLGVKLEPRDRVIACALLRERRDTLTVHTSRGREVLIRESRYAPVKRGGRGKEVIRLGGLQPLAPSLVLLQPSAEEQR